MSGIAPVLDGTVLVSVGAGLAAAPRVLRRKGRPGRGGFGPEAALAVVVALIYLNQVLFAVYVQRAHGGDTSFVARHLPPGWFAVPRGNPVIDWLAAHTPAPELLAPSVLRVQAFLELPLVLLAFLTVLRRLDRGLYRRVARSPLPALAAASYTVAFCAVEWDLRNPYTVDDIALRAVSAVVTPIALAGIAARDGKAEERPVTARGLLVFTVELWAIGHLMLVLYDTALLYNLARLGERLPGAAFALAVLVATGYAAGRSPGGPAGPAVTAVGDALRDGLTLFLVPALAIRYAGSFGTPELAAAAGGVVLLGAAAGLLRRHGPRVLLRLVPAAAAGAVAGGLAVRWAVDPYYEAALLRGATAALLVTIAVCALLDASRKPVDALP
ncbi:hypothetical protein [Kitasatospora sp. NPDC092286]|uniref:hypothetical protein n=1 Tax=Kitasatospora sp. NPDC092286 TaxID=3364087 RepID=UPI0037F5FBF7